MVLKVQMRPRTAALVPAFGYEVTGLDVDPVSQPGARVGVEGFTFSEGLTRVWRYRELMLP